MGEIDCSFLLHGTLGELLRDADYFRLARVDPEARTVVWRNGLDPAPELLHELATAPGTHPSARRLLEQALATRAWELGAASRRRLLLSRRSRQRLFLLAWGRLAVYC